LNNEINIDELIKRIQEEEEYVRTQTLNYQEYLPEFLSKAQEDLEIIENNAIELEKNPGDYGAINSMFRSFHNIKGSSGFVGQAVIQKIAHQTETLLDSCRKGTLPVTKKIIDLILKSVDYVKSLCENNELNEDSKFIEQIDNHVSEVEQEENSVEKEEVAPENIEIKTEDELKTECFQDFIKDVQQYVENIEKSIYSISEDEDDGQEILISLFKDFHTIKGFAGFSGQLIIQKIVSETETFLSQCIKSKLQLNADRSWLISEVVSILKVIFSDYSSIGDAQFINSVCAHLDRLKVELAVVEDESQIKHDIDAEFMEDFILEAKEHIENIEMNILSLEKEPENEEIIHSLFRSFHTIKGLAGFVEQSLIEKVAHKTETLLDGCRKKNIQINKNVIDSVLTSSDYIKKICENPQVVKDRALLNEVNTHLNGLENVNCKCTELKIGEILVQEKKLQTKDVDEIIEKQKSDYPELKFGQIAIKEKKVEAKDVISAVRSQQPKQPVAEEYMRISTGKVDNLVDMVGELVITQSLVEQNAAPLSRLTRITKDLQNLAMYLRLIPLKSTFQKISRIARDTINELGKDVDFSTIGDEIEIDRIVTEKLLDPLVHLVKNAIWHGIDQKGTVTINAYNKRGSIYIEITDNGQGINTEKVYKKALEKGLIEANKEYSEREMQEFILLPGFSTVDVANNIAGRGVGLDVVRTEIQKIGGKIEITSEKGKGSTFTLKIPVNHAIMNGTIVDIGGSNYIVPTVNVKQILQPTEDQWVYIKGQKSQIKVRNDIIPLVSIKKLFGFEETESNLVIVIELDQKYRALPLRNVIDRREIVVKPAGVEFAHLKFIAGMSILGDGKVSLILDIESMFKMEGE